MGKIVRRTKDDHKNGKKIASAERIMTTKGTQFWDAEQIQTTW
jgi:hypothetical protein